MCTSRIGHQGQSVFARAPYYVLQQVPPALLLIVLLLPVVVAAVAAVAVAAVAVAVAAVAVAAVAVAAVAVAAVAVAAVAAHVLVPRASIATPNQFHSKPSPGTKEEHSSRLTHVSQASLFSLSLSPTQIAI